jgi:hypothetical protein
MLAADPFPTAVFVGVVDVETCAAEPALFGAAAL